MTNTSTATSPNAATPAAIAPSGGGRGVLGPRTAVFLEWSLAGLAVPPLAILPHELGHYLVLLAMDVPNPAMHHATVSWDSREFWEAFRREDYVTAADIAPIWGVALSSAAGPLVSYAMVAGCCYGCVRWHPYAVLVAVGYACPLRLFVGVRHGVLVLLGGDPPANYDELRVAELTGIPVQVLVGFGVAVICISGAWLARYLPRGRRSLAVASMLAGAVFSAVLYFGYAGPWLLP